MTVGERIKKIRLEKGMTQQDLAKRTGINDANIRKYEGGRQNPKLETLERIAAALEVDPYYLVFGDEKIQSNDTISITEFRGEFNADKMKEDILRNALDDTMKKYNSLNSRGKEKANDYITDLTKIDEYTVPDDGTGTEDKDNE